MEAAEATAAASSPAASVPLPRVTWAAQDGSQELFLSCPIEEICYEGTRGPGKCLNNNEKILTDSGWRRVGEVTMQDRLVALDGTYTDILGVFPQGIVPLYRVTFDDGGKVEVCADHLWSVWSGTNGWRDGWVVRTTRDLIASKEKYWAIPTMTGPATGAAWTGRDPYMIGLLLGDGTMRGDHATLYTDDEWIRDYAVTTHGWRAYRYDYSTTTMVQSTRSADSDSWKDAVGRHKGADKRVPQALLEADPAARLAVLQGLMDSDGSVDKQGRCRFVSLSEELARGVQYLARSLGGKASCYREDRPSHKGGADWRWRVTVMPCGRFNPFRLPRKAARAKVMQGGNRRIVSIEQVADAPATCFAVDHPSRLFVVQDFIVTHNTDALLMKFAMHTNRGFGAWWRGVIFRQTYPQLDEIVVKSKRWFYDCFPAAQFNHSTYTWHFPGGEQLLLRHFASPDVYWNYHGHEYPFIGWEEITAWPTIDCYDVMKACLRSSCPDPRMPRFYLATTNPYGVGHNWVKRYWIDIGPPGTVITDAQGRKRVRIHGSVYENKALLRADPDYIKRLEAIEDPNRRKAWLYGSWDITSGGLFDDLWDRRIHVMPSFRIPFSWRIDRGFDWGSSRPFCVLWFAESDGTAARMRDGNARHWPRGHLFVIAEWYGWNGKDNEGCGLLASDIAAGIVAREEQMRYNVRAGPADSSIWDAQNGRCIYDDMKQVTQFVPADKSPGSRKAGAERIRILLAASKKVPQESPGLTIFENCTHLQRTFPTLPRSERDPDDVDSDAEDHAYDVLRYRTQSPTQNVRLQRISGT